MPVRLPRMAQDGLLVLVGIRLCKQDIRQHRSDYRKQEREMANRKKYRDTQGQIDREK